MPNGSTDEYLLNWNAHSCIPKMQTRMLIAEVFEMAPKLKTIQMSISGRLEREIAVYLYSAIMHNNEKKRAMTVYNSMAKSHKQNIEEGKPGTRE